MSGGGIEHEAGHRPPTPTRGRVLIVEDHIIVREGLAKLVEAEGEWTVCGQAADGAEALAAVRRLSPDIVMLDFVLDGGDGFDLVRALAALPQAPRVLVISAAPESDLGERAIAAGARGFLNKRADGRALSAALREIAAGGVVATPAIKLRLAAAKFGLSSTARRIPPLGALSDREFEVLQFIGSGLAVSEIAFRLGISVRTVETHRESIKNKLSLHTAAEVGQWARAWLLGGDPARR